MNFADRLRASIEKRSSYLVAGFDPRLDTFPKVFLDKAKEGSTSDENAIYTALTQFYFHALEALKECVAAVKPNIAFFEQYGVSGVRAFHDICLRASEHELPVIADIKRGDIGSTAEAYARAYLGESDFFGERRAAFHADAITVNPFLGYDTLRCFLDQCEKNGKGIFVMVKTSNSGSGDLQDLRVGDGTYSVSERIALWLGEQQARLLGESGYSSLGAVVGATYPEKAASLRELMPKNLFLIPGFGSQGGDAKQAVAGFGAGWGGSIVNTSRALLSSFSSLDISPEEVHSELLEKAKEMNKLINDARS